MDYSYPEIDQLTTLLEAEMKGSSVDPAECRRLASRVAELYPEIAGSMRQILVRDCGPGISPPRNGEGGNERA